MTLPNFSPRRRTWLAPTVLIALSCVGVAVVAAQGNGQRGALQDLVIGEFEQGDFGGWQTEGKAFGRGPVMGKRLGELEIQGARGNGAASSEEQGDEPTGRLTSPVFRIERRFLSFAIGGGDHERTTCLNLIVDGQVVRSETGRNSDRLRSVSWDIGTLMGKAVQLQVVDEATGDWGHINVDHILQTDRPEQAPVTKQPLYEETYRPQFHFTARQWTTDRLNPGPKQEGWINDMNGLLYYDGEYHLFAQRWFTCWIHAVSRDLVHWTELGPAFFEESVDSGTQSGTCVVDYNNTSGLSPDPKRPPMVAFWSRANNRDHCICYSLDHGRTWKRYEKNPVLVYPERDPKVFWHEPTHRWVMMMYGDSQYHIFTSANLLEWRDEKHPIPDSFECPDFFELPLDGDQNQMKWVLVRGNGKYSVGSFNGSEFKEETPQFLSDIGPNFYATQTWENTRTGDGRRIQAAWMRGGAYPEMPFNQQATFPCELTLHSTPDGPRLFREPIKEIALLHGREERWSTTVPKGTKRTLSESGDLFHIKADVRIPEGAIMTMFIRGIPLIVTNKTVACGTDPQKVHGEIESLEILIDRTSIEVFANHGEISLSRCYLPSDDTLAMRVEGGDVTFRSLSKWWLKSAWKK